MSAPVGVEWRAREAVALALDERGHHTEANNVRKGIDLDEYRDALSIARAALARADLAQQPAAVDEKFRRLAHKLIQLNRYYPAMPHRGWPGWRMEQKESGDWVMWDEVARAITSIADEASVAAQHQEPKR